MTGTPLLETRALTKEFRGFRAVSEVDLSVARGTVHALVGPNGAGKTTLFNLLTGFLSPTSGTSCSTARTSPASAPEADRTARHRALLPDHEPLRGDDAARAPRARARQPAPAWASGAGARSRGWPVQGPRHGAARAGGPRRPRRGARLVARLRPEARARARHRHGARPQAAAPRRADRRAWASRTSTGPSPSSSSSRTGRTVVFVDHNMHVVGSLADRVTVLQSGQVLAEGPYEQVRADERVITAYLGAAHE